MGTMETRRLALRFAMAAWLSVGASACAVTRGVVDIRLGPGVAPSEGTAVSLVSVEDHRRFELAPGDPSIPSLKDRRIDDPAITSRAIARKRNTYGQALGDILLPEGRRVQDVIGEAVTQALHGSGFRVVEPGGDADALRVEILEMWAWASPGFWAMHLESRFHIRITGQRPPFAGGREFRGYVRLATQAATGAAWQNTIDKGLLNLIQDMETQLAGSAGVASAPP